MNYMKQKTLARIIKCPLSQSFVALSTCPSTFSVSFEDILVKKKKKKKASREKGVFYLYYQIFIT